jgi:hypothetical protein
MEEFGRLRGVRTFGAPYSIQTTRLPKFNIGGDIESFGPNKTMVSGPSSINYDDRLGSVPLGGYVLNQQAAMDPANAPLVAMAPSTYLNDGGNITAALTPREVVFGPQIQRMPELYAAVDAANSGYNFGGQIMSGTYGYGRESTLSIWARLVNSKDYPKVIRAATVASDAAILSQLTGMDIKDATKRVSADYDSAIEHAKKAAAKNGTRKTEEFVKARTAQLIRLSKEFPGANLILDKYSDKNKYDQNAKSARMKAIAPQTYAGTMRSVIDDLVKEGVLTQAQAKKVFGILGQTSDFYDPISKSHTMTAKRSASIFKPGELQALLVEEGMSRAEAEKYAGVTGVRSNNFVGQSTGLSRSFNTMGNWLQQSTDGVFLDEVSPFKDEAKSNFIAGIKKLKAKLGITGPTTMKEIIRQLTLSRIKSGVGYNSKMVTTLGGRLAGRGISFAKPALGPLAGAFNKGGMIPGGSISRNRKNYGFVSPALRLLAPAQQLKILQQAREMSATTPAGYIPASYSHLLTPSTGRSFPVPGVAGVYQNEEKKKVFFKAVPNEVSLTAEMRGTEIGRILGLVTPVQVARSIRNPLDPTGKSRFLGAESDYDEGFINPNTSVPGKFTQDEVLDQFIASMILANKDLSRSNVHGRRLADVGNGGVLAKASMNDDYAKTLPSMEEMALANLLQVKGGSRKDFARDTAPIIAKMTAKEYGDKIKEKMEAAYPELKRYIKSLPKKDRKPYDALLKRFEEGMDVDWSKYHAMHVNPKYLNAGGPVGGGPVQRSRYAYGRKKDGSRVSGNPAKRAQQERLKAERSVTPVSRSGYTSSGNPQMQVQQIPYVGGAGVFGNAFGASQTGQSQQAINTLRLSQIGQLPAGITRSFKSLTDSIKLGTVGLRYGIMNSGKYLSSAYADYAKERISSARTTTRTIREGILREQSKRLSAAYPGQMMPMYMSGPGAGVGSLGAVGAWKDSGQDGVKSRKVGTYGYRRREFMDADGKIYNTKAAKAAGIDTRVRGGMGMGAQMGIGMAGSMGAMSLMQQEKVLGMSGMTAGLAVMGASTILPMLPWKTMASSVKSTTASIVASVKAFKNFKDAISKTGAAAADFVKKFKLLGATLSVVLVGLDIWKKYSNAQQDAAMALSITAKGAEQAGIKYFNLNQYLTDYIEKQKLANAAAQGSKSNSIGMPGIPQSIDEMKKAKEDGKVLKELIESINRTSSTGELQRLINNQKAQYVAGGLSIEQANSMIYGAIANSEKASQAYKLLADQGFGAIQDKSTAAEYAVSNLVNTLNNNKSVWQIFNTKDVSLWNPMSPYNAITDTFADANAQKKAVISGFESMIGIVNAGTQALIGTKNAQGDLIDEHEAYQTILASTEKNIPEFNIPIGKDTYDTLVEMSPKLAEITNKFDTLKSIIAKTKLFTSGINIDLKAIDANLAIKLAGFTAAIGSGISELTKAGDENNTYGSTGKVLKRLQESILATSAASQKAAAVSQRNIQEEIKLIAKKISLIEDEKNKKLDSLRATQDASNYALELQKLQIEYADAVARGDVSGAARARISIDQLTSNRQADLAEKAIQDEAARLKAIEQKKIDAKQAAADKKAIAFQDRQDNATNAAAVMDVVKGFKATYDEITALRITNSMMPESEAKRKAEAQLVGKLDDLLKKVGVAGTGSSETAKAIRESFAQYFNKDGTVKKVYVESPGLPDATTRGVTATTITTLNKDILKILDRDVALVSSMATQITGGKGYSIKTMTEEIVAALKGKGTGTYSDPINAGTTVGQLGKSSINWGDKYDPNSSREQVKKFAQKKGYKPGTNFYFREADGTIKQFVVLKDGNIQLQKITTKADGGPVRGEGTGTSDSIPAMLSNGEYVVRASSVAKYGVEALDALNAQKLHKGGPVGHRHGRNLPGSKFRWNPYDEDMPDYWSDGSPSGSPYTQRWGALRYGPAKGKDIWGGTEIPGLPFSGKIANRSDYWHQIAEQPIKYSGPGMGLDKDPMRYAGSGASMGGIGNGVYGPGFMTFATGGFVGNKNGNWFSKFNPVNAITSFIEGIGSGMMGRQTQGKATNVKLGLTQQEKDRALLQTAQMLSGYTSAFNLKNNTSPEIFGNKSLGVSADLLALLPAIGGLTKLATNSTSLLSKPAAISQNSAKLSIENGILRFKKSLPNDGVKINTKTGINNLLSKVAADDAIPYNLARDFKMTSTSAGEYSPNKTTITMPPSGMSGGTAVHEYAHHLDFTTKNWSFDAWLNSAKDNFDDGALAYLRKAYDSAQEIKLGQGQAAIENILTNFSSKNPNLIGNYRAVQEGVATDKTAGLYNSLVGQGKLDIARLIGNPYAHGTGYFSNFTHMARVLDENPSWRSPAYPEGFLAEGASKAMPASIRARYQSWVDKMKEYEITPGMDPMDPKWVALKYWAKENNFANGGLVGYHKGGPVGHRHGRNLPLNQEQKARKNKNLSYYDPKIDGPIKNYSDTSAKILTSGPFGIFAPLGALAADLFGVYFQGKTPGFGKNGAADLNPKSYEQHVSALMQGMFNPFAEIAKGSATTGDWVSAGLNFVPGVGAIKGVSALRARSAAYKIIDKAAISLPSEARVSLLPNAKLRSNFVALKKEGDLNSPEFAKARYELALSDALRAAKRNKFTALPDLKNTTAANLIEENKNLPKTIEELIKIEGKDYLFRFEKGDILPTDAPYIDKFLAGLKEGKETSKTFSAGGMHQAEILDPITKKQLSWVNYDPVTGYVHYRGTHVGYRGQHLSDALWNKATSITRIKHSDTLTDMGRPSALRIGGFMADDPYYGAVTSIPNLKQYLDMLMKIGKSKKPKPSTGEARSGIGSWLSGHTPSRQPSQPTSQPSSGIGVFGSDSNRFNDRNSIIGFQDDRLLYWSSADELRNSLRPEVVEWYGSPYRTSATFPYGPNGYIEPMALPELERILALERAFEARQPLSNRQMLTGEAYLESLRRGNGGYAMGGLVQNFSNSSLKNLGVPMFENGINMVPANMLAMLHKDEAVIPANMNPFNPNASAAVSGSVYNINVELNGTNVTAQDVATQIHREMRLKEMAAGVNRRVGG